MLSKHFRDDGVAAVVTPGFAPKRDRCADRRASLTTDGAAVSRLAISETSSRRSVRPAFSDRGVTRGRRLGRLADGGLGVRRLSSSVSSRRSARASTRQQQAVAGLDVLVVGEGESFVAIGVVVNLADVRVDVINSLGGEAEGQDREAAVGCPHLVDVAAALVGTAEYGHDRVLGEHLSRDP